MLIMRPRQRNKASRDSIDSNRNGKAVPMPNASMLNVTTPRFSPRAAMMEAATPGVGPTHGVHAAPRSRPTPNCPEMPDVDRPLKRFCVQLLAGPAAVAKPNLQTRHQQHRADKDQQRGRTGAEDCHVQTDGEADGGDEQTDCRER